MRNTLTVFITLVLFFVSCDDETSDKKETEPQKMPTNGLVAFFPFNGNANDASGNGNNGTVHGSELTSDSKRNLNSSYIFDGVDDFIDLGDFYVVNSGGIS